MTGCGAAGGRIVVGRRVSGTADRSADGARQKRCSRDSPRNSPLGPRTRPRSKRVPGCGVTGPPSVRGPNRPRTAVPSVAKTPLAQRQPNAPKPRRNDRVRMVAVLEKKRRNRIPDTDSIAHPAAGASLQSCDGFLKSRGWPADGPIRSPSERAAPIHYIPPHGPRRGAAPMESPQSIADVQTGTQLLSTNWSDAWWSMDGRLRPCQDGNRNLTTSATSLENRGCAVAFAAISPLVYCRTTIVNASLHDANFRSRRSCERIGTGTSPAEIFSGFGVVPLRSQSHFFTVKE